MTVKEFVFHATCFGAVACICAVPLVFAYAYAAGPAWIRIGDGVGVGFSAVFSGIALLIIAILSGAEAHRLRTKRLRI